MPNEVTISARIPDEINDQLTRLSEATGRTKSWVIKEALRSYLLSESAFLEAIEEGLADIRAGRVTPHEEVRAEIRRKIAETGQ